MDHLLSYSDQTTGHWATGTCLTGQQQSLVDIAKDSPFRLCNEILNILQFNPNLIIQDPGYFIFELTENLQISVNNFQFGYKNGGCNSMYLRKLESMEDNMTLN